MTNIFRFLFNCLLISFANGKPSLNVKNDDYCPASEYYSSCNSAKDGFLNIHLVPHTHDDVGWLKTVDQYYYGSNNDQQTAAVQYVLDTVVDELIKDPAKRFVYVEIAYFWRWWQEQSEETKVQVRNLVNGRRLEFVIAGWCMSDEATTYYQDMIDQMSLGLKFVEKEFGRCARPRTAWQIDPFGHSRELASLFAQFGYDALFLGRIDYQDKDTRGIQKTREMLWQSSANLKQNNQLFTGVLENGYNPPNGLCFDASCDDEPIMDDKNLDEYNVDAKVQLLYGYARMQQLNYRTNNVIMTMGSDFQFSNAHMWYKNLDKLIYYANKQLAANKINVFYSTPACYLWALHQANETWPTKSDDFFPYAHRPHTFWTGYFTSRAALKKFVRDSNNFLQSVRQMATLSGLRDSVTQSSVETLEHAMGVAQHHDAVSGTERQHVARDYAKRLSRGINDCVPIIQNAYNEQNGLQINDLVYCSLLNLTQCAPIEGKTDYTLIVYNPLARVRNEWISLPVVTADYIVQTVDTEIETEFIEVNNRTRLIPERNSTANYEMLFNIPLPPLQFTTFSVSKNSKRKTKERSNQILHWKDSKSGDFTIQNNYIQLGFDANGNLKSLNSEDSTTTLLQQLCYYQSMGGNNSDSDFQASGAYIFRPNGKEICVPVTAYNLRVGKQYAQVEQIYNDWLGLTIRLYVNERFAQFMWQVGPIPIADSVGKEVIIKFWTDLQTNGTFYTDSNGREMLKRVRDYRETWPLNQTESISGNYYPINSRIFIRDELKQQRQLTLVTDRSQGGSSIHDGSVEIMLHRRILMDDALGVSEPLNETGQDGQGLIVTGNIYLLFNNTQSSARWHRDLAHRINTQPLVTFAEIESKDTKRKNKNNLFDIGPFYLPFNLHLLTMMNEDDDHGSGVNRILVRIEHFFEYNEDEIFSNTVTLDLAGVFNGSDTTLLGVEELALGANMNVEELNERLKWNIGQNIYSKQYGKYRQKAVRSMGNDQFTFTFDPMQIRTFRLWFQA